MNFSPGFGVGRKYKPAAFILIAAALVFLAPPAVAQDDDYLTVYSVIEQADSLAANGRTAQAHAKYLEAQRDLAAFKQDNPNWNNQMVSYRMDYVADKIKVTSGENVSATGDNSSMPKASSAPISPVKLLEAGSEPLKVLRLHPAVGDKQSVTMTLQMNMAMSAAGNSVPAMNLPAMVMTMDSEVKDVSPDGEISYAIVFSSADVVSDKDTPP
ncbi:MAG TPA: hypothetical protein VK742_21590, partial [Candidatus Sulfotelmatobacter sp.]|nr:hypothetical protein [Candidatus Sulfotelmatobacter sp.]